MRKKIFRGALLLTVLAVVLMGVLNAVSGYQMAQEQLTARLWQELDSIASLQGQDDEAYLAMLEQMKVADRLTWVASDGKVLYDNQSQAIAMENHGQREEILAAQTESIGFAKRYSNTLLEEQLYCAKRLTDGSTLRVSATQRSIGGYLGQMLWVTVLGGLVICLLAALLSRKWVKSLVKPLNEIDLEHPLNTAVYDELSPMLRRMEAQNRKVESQWQELEKQQRELNAILSHMREGLLILDRKTHVLMMNESAERILHVEREVDGKTPLLVYNRSQILLGAVEAALNGENAHAELAAGGRDYLITVSAVGEQQGLVVLIMDVTEQNAAEKARKRFSANVSHELRTPLTTISGYAELMQNGMNQPQDVPVFARKIYDESQRMIQLIEDILHLSKLDEGNAEGRREPVNLLETARSAAEENRELAKDRTVSVSVQGEEAFVMGDPTLLEEMLRNLVENAIKYNRPKGEVQVRIDRVNGQARVTVADNGIGIPQEHQSRVFERFYRVDKSRSKQTGGTGLGLSIVKHGAEYHHAEISLTSEVNAGTTITLVFPDENRTKAEG